MNAAPLDRCYCYKLDTALIYYRATVDDMRSYYKLLYGT